VTFFFTEDSDVVVTVNSPLALFVSFLFFSSFLVRCTFEQFSDTELANDVCLLSMKYLQHNLHAELVHSPGNSLRISRTVTPQANKPVLPEVFSTTQAVRFANITATEDFIEVCEFICFPAGKYVMILSYKNINYLVCTSNFYLSLCFHRTTSSLPLLF